MQPNQPIPTPPKPTPNYKLQDFGAVKDFIDYGMNKSLVDLKVRKMVDVKTRETLMNKKGEHDYMKIFTMIAISITVGLIGFTLITQFMNYTDMAQGLANCIVDMGSYKSALAQCEALGSQTIIPTDPIMG